MKNVTKALGAVGVGLLVVATGCTVQRDIDGYQTMETEGLYTETEPEMIDEVYSPGAGDLQLSDASLRGSVGDVGVDDEGAWVDGYADGQYASVYTTVDEAMGGAVMTIVDVEGGLDHADFQPGSRTVFRADDLYEAGPGEVFVTVIGCSGPNAGAWEFDQTADVVTVDVEQDPNDEGGRIFEYTARFDNGYTDTSVVTGRFTAN